MATTRIKDLSKTATTVNSDANLVLDGNTGGTQKISRDNFRQDTADAFVAAPGTYNLAPLNSGTGKIDAVYLSSSSDTPKGAWDASSNTPTLADGSGTAGDYYDVTVAGSSDLGSGSIAFTVGDVVKYNGTVWFKIDSVANILDGVSTIDGAKTAIEIPDVGTAPNEVPLNGMLGDMAYQSSDGVSMGVVEADQVGIGNSSPSSFNSSADDLVIGNTSSGTDHGMTLVAGSTSNANRINFSDGTAGSAAYAGSINYYHSDDRLSLATNATTAVTIDSSQRVGIGNSSPGSYANGGADDLVIGDATGSRGITISTGSAETGSLYFGDDVTSGAPSYRGMVRYVHASNQLQFATQSSIRWYISSSGDLVANGAHGIDFGTVAGGTGTPTPTVGGLLDDFETGTWSGTYVPQTGSFATMTMSTDLVYTKVGNLVHISGSMSTNNVDITGGSNGLKISGLPFAAAKLSAISIGFAWNWNTASPLDGYIFNSEIWLQTRSSTTARTDNFNVTNLYTGAATGRNHLYIEATYKAS